MVKNNHFKDNRRQLDRLLRSAPLPADGSRMAELIGYAHTLTRLENTVVVISDMQRGESRIIAGGFGVTLGLTGYDSEDSIWEQRILELMLPEERENKFIAELRFFHFVRHLPKHRKSDYYLECILRFILEDGSNINVMHKMYYVYDNENENVMYAVCQYSPIVSDLKCKSRCVNSLTGETIDLASTDNDGILSGRECRVLSLINDGMKSAEIAERLHISIHTVSRHRQKILSKLKVRNSIEACRLAMVMGLISQ